MAWDELRVTAMRSQKTSIAHKWLMGPFIRQPATMSALRAGTGAISTLTTNNACMKMTRVVYVHGFRGGVY